MTKERFEELKPLVIELDAFLTEKETMAQHMMYTQAEEFERMMLDDDTYIYYLADGGMSRIVLKFHPNFESYCNPTVFFTSNSMQKVKDRWNMDKAQQLIGQILYLMFTPDQTMLDEFKKIDVRSADPDNEFEWDSVIFGWALAKGLSPRNAHSFWHHVRFDTVRTSDDT